MGARTGACTGARQSWPRALRDPSSGAAEPGGHRTPLPPPGGISEAASGLRPALPVLPSTSLPFVLRIREEAKRTKSSFRGPFQRAVNRALVAPGLPSPPTPCARRPPRPLVPGFHGREVFVFFLLPASSFRSPDPQSRVHELIVLPPKLGCGCLENKHISQFLPNPRKEHAILGRRRDPCLPGLEEAAWPQRLVQLTRREGRGGTPVREALGDGGGQWLPGREHRTHH